MDILGGYSLLTWSLFNLLILGLLAFDLGVLNRKGRVVGFREAILWNVAWAIVALIFGGFVFVAYGQMRGLEYLTGYVIERALSVDNIFVFVVVFRYFGIPPEHQRGVLFWGILGALVMRGSLILAGTALVLRFHWLLYLFGAFLVYSGIMLLVKEDVAPDPGRNLMVRLATRFLRVAPGPSEGRFFVRKAGRLYATTLLIVLLVVETTDLVFALDSIPAIFAVTRDPFIIYTSNAFAVIGMCALYFLLAALLPRFRYLAHGLSVVLILIGLRMLLDRYLHIETWVMLVAVCTILGTAVAASMLVPVRPVPEGEP